MYEERGCCRYAIMSLVFVDVVRLNVPTSDAVLSLIEG